MSPLSDADDFEPLPPVVAKDTVKDQWDDEDKEEVAVKESWEDEEKTPAVCLSCSFFLFYWWNMAYKPFWCFTQPKPKTEKKKKKKEGEVKGDASEHDKPLDDPLAEKLRQQRWFFF